MLFLLFLPTVALAYSTSAGSCNEPGHGSAAAAGNGGYSVTFSETSWTPGAPITVVLDGADSYLGFLLRAVSTTGTNVGTWSGFPAGTSGKSCSGGTDAVMHTSNVAKTRLSFTWTPPAQGLSGNVVFTTVIVRSPRTLWYKFDSAALPQAPSAPSASPSASPPPSPPPPSPSASAPPSPSASPVQPSPSSSPAAAAPPSTAPSTVPGTSPAPTPSASSVPSGPPRPSPIVSPSAAPAAPSSAPSNPPSVSQVPIPSGTPASAASVVPSLVPSPFPATFQTTVAPVTVSIPPTATAPTEIKVSTSQDSSATALLILIPPAVGSGKSVDVKPASTANLPSANVFSSPVSIELEGTPLGTATQPLTQNVTLCFATNLQVADLRGYHISFLDESGSSWVPKSQVTRNSSTGLLCGNTDHLSTWAVTYVQPSAAPVPKDSTPPAKPEKSSKKATSTWWFALIIALGSIFVVANVAAIVWLKTKKNRASAPPPAPVKPVNTRANEDAHVADHEEIELPQLSQKNIPQEQP